MKSSRIAAWALALSCAAVQAASLDQDKLLMCDRAFDISAELRPSALMEAAAADLDKGRFDRVFPLFADRFDATLPAPTRATPEVSRFLANVRAGREAPRFFDVVPDDTRTKEVIFEGSPGKIELDCTKLAPHEPDMASVSLMTGWVRGQQMLPALGERARFVARQSRDHEALLKNGLPMWPWELWLNGKRLGKNDWEPLFRTQWVLMRPTAGIELDARSRAEGDLEASVGIEPVGFVSYRDADYASWWGASLLVTASTREGIGLGALLRWNNYVLGVTQHESDTPGKSDGIFVFLGLDLYQLANKKREEFSEWKDLQKNRVDALLKNQKP